MSKKENDFRIVTVTKSKHIMTPRDLYGELDPQSGQSFIISVQERTKDLLILKIKRVNVKDLQALA